MKKQTKGKHAAMAACAPSDATGYVQVPVIHSFDDLFPPTPSEIKERRRSVAFHEAGHLFAAFYLGFSLKQRAAEMLSAGPVFGLTHFYQEKVSLDGSSQSRQKVEDAIVVLLSGCAAISKLRRSYESGYHLADNDFREARLLIEAITPALNDADLPWHVPGTERARYLRVMEYRAERLVSQNWTAVEALAKRLQQAGSITATEVMKIVERNRAWQPITGSSGRRKPLRPRTLPLNRWIFAVMTFCERARHALLPPYFPSCTLRVLLEARVPLSEIPIDSCARCLN